MLQVPGWRTDLMPEPLLRCSRLWGCAADAASLVLQKPGWDSWDARGPHSEYPGLHRTTSHPGARASSLSPHDSPSFAAKGGGHRGDQLLKHTSLPHHLSSSSHSLPPGIFGAARDTPLPAPPPLLDAGAAALSPLLRPVPALEALPPPLLMSDPPEAAVTPPAASVAPSTAPPGLGAEPAAASDEPPKRKRLGWGQGLARLRTAEAASRPAEDPPDQSPRDAKAANHTDAHADSLSSPPFSVPVKSEPQLQLPGIFSSPSESARAALQRIVSPHSTASIGPSLCLPAPPPLLSMDGFDTWSTLETHASMDSLGSRAQKDGAPFSPRQPAPGGYPAALDQHGVPAASQATPATQGSMLPPAESLTEPEPEQAAPGPSKEDIMEGIDKVDTDIQALEKEVADLAASLDDTSAAAVALKGDISRLHVPAEQPPPTQLSDDEDVFQESSEVMSCTVPKLQRLPEIALRPPGTVSHGSQTLCSLAWQCCHARPLSPHIYGRGISANGCMAELCRAGHSRPWSSTSLSMRLQGPGRRVRPWSCACR